MKRIGLFCISSLFLFVQFVHAKEYRLKSQFDPASVQWSKTTGNAAVAGMGIYRLSDGTMKSCAGQTVYYYPYSDYVMEQLQFRMRGITNIKNLNPRIRFKWCRWGREWHYLSDCNPYPSKSHAGSLDSGGC